MKKITSLTAIILALTISSPSFAYHDTDDKAYLPLKSSAAASNALYDIQFLDTMMAHHRQGITMAEMATERAKNKDVKDRAQIMVYDQKVEISKMQTLRDSIKENAPEAINMKLDGMMSVDLKALDAENVKNFDEAFVRAAIEHKQGSKDMAKEASKRAKNSKVREISRDISNREANNITDLKTLLSDIRK
jgi:uncharacterized protein (DUF305 family)